MKSRYSSCLCVIIIVFSVSFVFNPTLTYADIGFFQPITSFFKKLLSTKIVIYHSEIPVPTPEPEPIVAGVNSFDITEDPEFQKLKGAYQDLLNVVTAIDNEPRIVNQQIERIIEATPANNTDPTVLVLEQSNFPDINCFSYGGGGKLTTDANGNIICESDRRERYKTIIPPPQTLSFNSSTKVLSLTRGTSVDLSILTASTSLSDLNITSGYVVRGGAGNAGEATSSIYMADSGNVGIGTTTPTSILSVAGTVQFAALTGGLLSADSAGNLSTTSLGVGALALTNGLTLRGSGSNLAEATSTLYISDNGNIGIGDLSPATKLEVGGAINISDTATGYALGGTRTLYASSTNYSTAIGLNAGANLLTGGLSNTAIGYEALQAATSSDSNNAFGYQALKANTSGSNNIAVGSQSLFMNTSGSFNIAVGDGAMAFNTSGISNTAVGLQALQKNLTGSSNVALGIFAMADNTTGSENVAVGRSALNDNQTGTGNVAVGRSALFEGRNGSSTAVGYYALRENEGAGNTAVGYEAGLGSGSSNSTFNTFIGFQAGYANTTGANNLLLGYRAGDTITTGSNNLLIGHDVDVPLNSTSNYLNIGNAIYGNLTSGYVGIGTSTPSVRLSVGNTLGSQFLVNDTGIISDGVWQGGSIGAAYLDPAVLINTELDSSGELATLLIDETGSGAVVFGTAPTMSSPTITGTLGAAAATFSGNLSLTGSTANIILGSNWLSGDGGDEGVFVSSNGNVGIGTSSPSSKLEVEVGAAGAGGILISGSNYPAMKVLSTDATKGGQLVLGNSGVSWSQYVQGNDLRIYDTADRITFQAGGNVGIGTTTPDSTLSVDGSFFLTQGFHLKDDGAVSFIIETTASSDPDLTFRHPLQDWTMGIDNSSSHSFKIGTGAGVGAAEILTLTTDGKAGIGTTSPTAKLHVSDGSFGGTHPTSWSNLVESTGNTITGILGGSTNSAILRFGNATDNDAAQVAYGESLINSKPALTLGTRTTNGQILFRTGDNTNVAIIDENGNVGIGTTSPEHDLHVYQSNSAVNVMFETTLTDSNVGLRLKNDAREWKIQNDGGLDDIFSIRDITAVETRFVIDTDGNVGIGTTTPAAKLHVYGQNDDFLATFTNLKSAGSDLVAAVSAHASGTNTSNVAFYGEAYGSSDDYGVYLTGEDYNYFSGNVGVGEFTPAEKLHVKISANSGNILRLEDGDSTCNFDASGSGPSCGSDRSLKKNISKIDGELHAILALEPSFWNWKTDGTGAARKSGFIAQDVELVLPELVTQSTWIDGTQKKFLNIGGMMPYVVGAIKEMWAVVSGNKDKIETLESRIEILESKLNVSPATITNGNDDSSDDLSEEGQEPDIDENTATSSTDENASTTDQSEVGDSQIDTESEIFENETSGEDTVPTETAEPVDDEQSSEDEQPAEESSKPATEQDSEDGALSSPNTED